MESHSELRQSEGPTKAREVALAMRSTAVENSGREYVPSIGRVRRARSLLDSNIPSLRLVFLSFSFRANTISS